MSDSAQEKRTWQDDEELRRAVAWALPSAADIDMNDFDYAVTAIIEAVEDWYTRRLHTPDCFGEFCDECWGRWPCKTIRELEAT